MPLEWIFIQILVNTVEVGALFYLLCSKFSAKYKVLFPELFFIAGITAFISLPIFIFFGGLPLTEIVMPLTCLIYLMFFRYGSLFKKIFWVLISFAIVGAITFFSITVITFISGVNSIDIITESSVERLMVMIIAKVLQIVVCYILAKKRRESNFKLSLVPILICFLIPLISFMMMIFIYFLILSGFNIPENIIFLISISYLIINILVFILYEIINREAEKNYILIAKNKQHELTDEHNRQIIEMYGQMSKWQHDYNNHMQLIAGMLEKSNTGDNSEAINYIKDLDEKIKSASLDIVTGNRIVDAIVSAKMTLASAYNIKFEQNILLPDALAIEDTDLCAILSNLLDNAIESCRKLELEIGRYIRLEIVVFKNQFNIKLENSANGEYKIENGKMKTTKRGNLHGIGISNIKAIIEKYRGVYNINPKVDSFITHISISLRR